MVRPAVAIALLMLAGLAARSLPPAGAQTAEPKPAVLVEPATREAVDRSATFTGRVDAINRVAVRARVPGFVEAIGFSEGARVAEGDILFHIEPDAYEAAVTRIEGQVKSAEADKALADIEVDRQRTLFERNTVAESVVQRAEAEQGRIEGRLLELQGSLRQAELDLSYTTIEAPFAGRVGLTGIDVGAFVGPDSGALVMLSSVDPIHVTFPVTEAELLDFRAMRGTAPAAKRLSAGLTLANGETYSQKGTIVVLDVEVQTGTDTVLVRASFPNPDGVLLEGQLVDVQVTEAAREASLTIPIEALQRDLAGYFTMVVDADRKVARRPLRIARIAGARVVVEEGLSEGEEVIVAGIQRVRAGIEVDAEVRTPATGPDAAATSAPSATGD